MRLGIAYLSGTILLQALKASDPTTGQRTTRADVGLLMSGRVVLVIRMNAPTDRCRFGLLLQGREESEG
jgi:hypothetical protein